MNLKSQIFIKEGYKGYVTLPTQLRKIALIGILDNGIPFDFQPNGTLENRKKNWNRLSDLKKRENSKKWSWYKQFTDTLNEMETVLKEELLADIQMKEVTNADGTKSYEGDSAELVKYIKNQLKDKELLPEEINYIAKEDGSLIDDLSFSLIGSKIEELLTTLVDKKLRRLKVNGEKLTQVSSALWESSDWKTGTKEDHVKYGTSGLKFHFAKDENGELIEDPKTGKFIVTEMEVKISLQGQYKKLLDTEFQGKPVKVYKKDEATGKRILDYDASLTRLNEAIKNPAWLAKYGKMIDIPGVRIPSQGSNAFIATRVAEFLPESAGPIIIMPSEVVVNTGSDYDVDAMFTLMKSFISKYGIVEEVKYLPNQKEDPLIILDAIATLEEERSILLEEKQELRGKYIEYLQEKANVNEKAQQYIDAIKENKSRIKTFYEQKKEVYNSKEFNLSKKKEIHKLLSDAIKQGEGFIEESEVKLQEVLSEFFDERVSNRLERKAVVNANFKKFNDPIKEIESKIKETERQLFQLEAKLQGAGVVGLENRLIDLIQERVLDPDNFAYLVKKNTTEAWEDMAVEADKKAIKEDAGQIAEGNTRIFQYRFNLLKHQEMSVSLDALGIAAVASTFYAVFTTFQATLQGVSAKDQKAFTNALEFLTNESNATLNPKKWEKSMEIVNNFQSRTLKLESNEVLETNSVSLGMVQNVNGQRIADLLSQLINGYVDAANDPWIAKMQGNKENTPTILFLTMAGVSPRDIISMMTNTAVLSYNSDLIKNKGIFGEVIRPDATEDLEAIAEEFMEGGKARKFNKAETLALKSFFEKNKDLFEENNYTAFTPRVILNKSSEFTEQELKDRIGKKIEWRDVEILSQFLAAKEMAEALRDFTLLTKFDTVKISSISEAQDRQEKISDFKAIPVADKIIPNSWFDEINNSPIGKFNNDQFIVDLFSRYFGVKNNPALILKSLGIKVPKGMDKRKVLVEFKDDFIWFLYQNAVYSLDTYTTSSTNIVDNKTAAPGKTYKLIEKENGTGTQEFEINEETGEVTYSPNILEKERDMAEFSPARRFFNNGQVKSYAKFRIELENLKKVSESMTNEQFIEVYGIFDNSKKSYLEQGQEVGRINILIKAALYNTMNPDAMFNFGTGVSSILRNIHSKYRAELNNYAFFRDIKYDYNEAVGKMNMYFPQIQDAQLAKVYRENIAELKNSPYAEVREFFGKFDHIAIMQTGLTLKSKYALTKLIDQNILENVIESNIGIKYINSVLEDINDLVADRVSRDEIDGQIIDQFAAKFNTALSASSQKVRGHNYTVEKLAFAKVKKARIKRGKNRIVLISEAEATKASSIPLLTAEAFFNSPLTPAEYAKRMKQQPFRLVNKKLEAANEKEQVLLDEALLILGVDNSGSLPKLVAQKKDIGLGLSIERSKILKPLHSIKDEAMANRATKVIGKATTPFVSSYKSSTQSYLDALSQGEYGKRQVIADAKSRKKQFTSKDVVWIFGSGIFSGAYENEEDGYNKYSNAIKSTFKSYHEKMIKKAIREGVQTFVVGDASGIDALAKSYLEQNGFSAVKQYTDGGIYYEMVKTESLEDIVVELYSPAAPKIYMTTNVIFNELLDNLYDIQLNQFGQDTGVRNQPEQFKALTSEEKENIGYDTVKELIINAIQSLDKKSMANGSRRNVSYRARLAYELKNSPKGLMVMNTTNNSLFDNLVEQVMMEFRNAAQPKAVVSKAKVETIDSIYEALGTETASENVEIVDNIWSNMKDRSVIKAYRSRKSDLLGAFRELNSIGNPITAEGKPVGQATKEFIGWLEGKMFTDLEQVYRQELLDAFESGELKGLKIEYYKDIGMPSHATVLDYYINVKPKLDAIKGDGSAITNYNQIFALGLLDESRKQSILENFGKKHGLSNPLRYIDEALANPKKSNDEIIEILKSCY